MDETEQKDITKDIETIKVIKEEYEKQLAEQKETYEKKLKEQEEELTRKHNEQIRILISGKKPTNEKSTEIDTDSEDEEDNEDKQFDESVKRLTEQIAKRYK